MAKKQPKSLRASFNDATNDNASLGSRNLTPAQIKRALSPPHDDHSEVLHGVTVHDPFRPLEETRAENTVAWTERENKKYEGFLAGTEAAQAEAMAFLKASKPSGMRESMASKYGNIYLVNRKEEDEERYSLFVKDVPDYGAPARKLLDPMELDPTGNTRIVATHATRDGKTLAYRTSVAGSDRETLHFMDIATGKDLPLVYEDMRTSVNWDRDGGGFHYVRQDKKTKTTSVHYHKMGEAPETDVTVYDPGKPETDAYYFRVLKDSKDETGDYEYLTVSDVEPDRNALLLRPRGTNETFREIFPNKEGSLSPFAEIGGRIYAETTFGAPNGRVVSIDPKDPSPDKWQTIIPESKQDPLTNAFVWQNKLFVTRTHDTGEQLKVFSLDGRHLHDVPVPPLSTFSTGQIRMDEKTFLISFSNYQETGNIYTYDADKNDLTLFKKSSTPIDLKDCIVERVEATSKDGTKVPMTVIRAKETKLDGTAATLLYGYGGFNVPMDPGFSAGIAQWVRAGGVYAVANLRGGGEFGQEWYDAGRLQNKQNVFDDFAACAEFLIDNKYTSNKRLAIQGGSNGGLLTLATMVQRPELFGAVVSEVPVSDMFRFHVGSHYGYGWKSDYGDPDVKADFNAAAKYSPLHNVPEGFKHPPLLISGDADDDRVLPWHSYKMAATLQAKESKDSVTVLSVRSNGGHSAGLTENQWYAEESKLYGFLTKVLGPINQVAYKAKLAADRAARAAQKKPKGPSAA